MNSNKIKLALIAAFALAANSAFSQSSDSTSSAQTSSTSTAIGQGGGSSISTNSNVTSSRGGNSALTNSGNSSSTAGVSRSGNAAVNVSVQNGTSSGTSSGTPAAALSQVGAPGSSPYNTNALVEYAGTQTVKTNPAIQAPGLTTTLSDTCMGSVSFGFSAPGFGATAGSTLVDQACVRRLDAREFRAMGLTDVALALLCQSDANRRAVEATGHLCPGTTAPLAKAHGEVGTTALVSDDVQFRDPIVRDRLGLPELDANKPAQQQARTLQPVQQAAIAPVMAPAPAAPAAQKNPLSMQTPVLALPVAPATAAATVPQALQPANLDAKPVEAEASAVDMQSVKTSELSPLPDTQKSSALTTQPTHAEASTSDSEDSKAGSKSDTTDTSSTQGDQSTPAATDSNTSSTPQQIPTSTSSENNLVDPMVAAKVALNH